MSARQNAPRPTVGIDVAPARHPPAGVGVYVSELASALEALGGRHIVRLGIREPGPLRPPDRSIGETRLGRRHHLSWLSTSADRDARSAGCRLVHYTNAVAPPRAAVPFVLTIHDLSILRLPRSHPAPRLATIPFIVWAARRARRIIVPSNATAGEVRRLLHVPTERTAVIPLAARGAVLAGPADGVLNRLGVEPGAYLLALGTIEPRKNHLRMLAAFERVALARPDLRLVLAGARGWRDGRFRRTLDRSPMRRRVVLAGHEPDTTVATLLESCAAMVYPSVYEGFGLPILEAMAAGAPVVTSRVSSMPEVAGGAAVLVDPTDVTSIADGISDALRRRDELVAAGRARAASRTWLDVARETLVAYDEALGSDT